jgi:hypothetical protein
MVKLENVLTLSQKQIHRKNFNFPTTTKSNNNIRGMYPEEPFTKTKITLKSLNLTTTTVTTTTTTSTIIRKEL